MSDLLTVTVSGSENLVGLLVDIAEALGLEISEMRLPYVQVDGEPWPS